MVPKTHSPKFLRRRGFLLFMPLLVLPFATLMFWALGGGKVNADARLQKGFNTQLPGANLRDDKPLDKLSYYEKAALDSAKLLELMKNDPYYKIKEDTDVARPWNFDSSMLQQKYSSGGKKQALTNENPDLYADVNETKVYQKLDQLNRALNEPAMQKPIKDKACAEDMARPALFPADAARLEQMAQMMKTGGNADDPEMQQINGMLEKILDIQHPERVSNQLKQKSIENNQQIFVVSRRPVTTAVSLIDTAEQHTPFNAVNGFYGLNDEPVETSEQNAIEAIVHENQTVINGGVVKLRLLNDIYINGSLIQKGNFISGIATLNNERLSIDINSVRKGNSLFPVKLSVYDMDGLPGIYIPGAITSDVAKQSADNSLQLMELSSMDPSFKAQAASAGISAAKNLFSKKVKQVKVMIKAGYKVLLNDRNSLQ